ncbi:hypothetical protein HORIV_67490 [Vreelandella olivaria]|uniref:Uncharacterized protein n=1 Tax=Vreelandella olivaria TaxID=390919 RepID=A0ABM7GU69_9GAMM|nr:hypothetical protein HORIV_67490 [Halomonas olivaria]
MLNGKLRAILDPSYGDEILATFAQRLLDPLNLCAKVGANVLKTPSDEPSLSSII